MAKVQPAEEEALAPKPLVWLHGEIKTPPFTAEGRQEAGMLLRLMHKVSSWECLRRSRCRTSASAAERYGFVMRNTTGESCTALIPMPS